MPELDQAQIILAAFGLPPAQQNEMAALTLLALCGLKPTSPWSAATRSSMTVRKGIMAHIERYYGRAYAPNTRETFRRQGLHQFVQARIADYNPDNPHLPTNSPKAHYAIAEAALVVIRVFGTDAWQNALDDFETSYGNAVSASSSRRTSPSIPLTLPDGSILSLSPGKHNRLQVEVVEHFAPRFASGSILLYLGDTADKDLFVAREVLARLNIPITAHDKLPDILLYDASRNWLFLIEAVTSHGPMSTKRLIELTDMLRYCPAAPIFMTAFLTWSEFRKHLKYIAWETEVWIAENPDHLIHFNGIGFSAHADRT